jgi:hypothetical protein
LIALLQITSNYFCAGLVSTHGRITLAAPIIKYMKGWPFRKVSGYCDKKHWQLNRVSQWEEDN